MADRPGMLDSVRLAARKAPIFRLYRRRDRLRATLCRVNVALGQADPQDPLTRRRVRELDTAAVLLGQARWHAERARATGDTTALKRARQAFTEGQRLADRIEALVAGGNGAYATDRFPILERAGTEIDHCQGVPLVPAITPVVVLRGSDEEMGAQYARQIAAIFGRWILRYGVRRLTADERVEVGRWEAVHGEHLPWLGRFVDGWVAGARESGVNLDRASIMDLWVGHRPPATSWLDASSGLPELPPIACTSLAAWGESTPDGALVAAATGDHELSYQVTVAAFPDDGHPFVHTIFSAAGTLPTVGPNWFFGHPGMSRSGLAYVHHGGGPKFLEPRHSWGYGLRRTPSVWHLLRYATSAHDAREMEQSWPIGDVGRGDQATVGGFYADADYAYIIEGRDDPVAVREAGLLGERDFLYANNSAMHPDAVRSEWMRRAPDGSWLWDREGGYRPATPRGMTKSPGMLLKWLSGRMSTDELLVAGMQFAYWNSYHRNVFLRRMADAHHGHLDVGALRAIYRTVGTAPTGSWAAAVRRYRRTGEWSRISAAHASNAFVAIMKPSTGYYSLCTGPARRGAAPMSPDSAMIVRGETNAFWDLELPDTPTALVERAEALADRLLGHARDTVAGATHAGETASDVAEWLAAAQTDTSSPRDADGIEALGRRVRAATRAQVRARQILHLGDPPPEFTLPERRKPPRPSVGTP